MLTYDISFSDLLHSIWQSLGLSMSLFKSSFYHRESRIFRYFSKIKKLGKVGTRIQSQATCLQHLSSHSLIFFCSLLKLRKRTYIYLFDFTRSVVVDILCQSRDASSKSTGCQSRDASSKSTGSRLFAHMTQGVVWKDLKDKLNWRAQLSVQYILYQAK